MIKIRKSKVTGHWVVSHFGQNLLGFKRWADAITYADREVQVRRDILARLSRRRSS